MLNRNKLIPLFTFLLVLFASSGFSYAVNSKQTNDHKIESVAKNTFSENSQDEILGVHGILHSTIRMNENHPPTFETFKSKKASWCHSFFLSFAFSSSSYFSYRSDRINKINSCPYYIAYCRLTI